MKVTITHKCGHEQEYDYLGGYGSPEVFTDRMEELECPKCREKMSVGEICFWLGMAAAALWIMAAAGIIH